MESTSLIASDSEAEIDADKIVAEARVALMRLEAVESASRRSYLFRTQAVLLLGVLILTGAVGGLMYIRLYVETFQTYITIIGSTSTVLISVGCYYVFKRSERYKLLCEADRIKVEISELLREVEPHKEYASE